VFFTHITCGHFAEPEDLRETAHDLVKKSANIITCGSNCNEIKEVARRTGDKDMRPARVEIVVPFVSQSQHATAH
jgi:hypothetical protein